MNTSDWNTKQYLKFENERTQPAIDLINRICMDKPRKIVDIGCGPGNSTNVLARRFESAYILGIDNSSNMIEAARRDYPGIDFELCDAQTGLAGIGGDFDIVFSNACIQWIPDHYKLLGNFMALLKKEGTLAVQIPMIYDEPIHKIVCSVSENTKWISTFSNRQVFYYLTQGEYFDLLSEISAGFTMWQTTYFHIMKSHKDILEWYKGTGMRPYLNALSVNDRIDFEQKVYNEIVEAYPIQKNGDIIFRFPRLFIVAVK